jgi:hypothetical protein
MQWIHSFVPWKKCFKVRCKAFRGILGWFECPQCISVARLKTYWIGHYTKMWFLWLGDVATIAQNNHVVVSGLES